MKKSYKDARTEIVNFESQDWILTSEEGCSYDCLSDCLGDGYGCEIDCNNIGCDIYCDYGGSLGG